MEQIKFLVREQIGTERGFESILNALFHFLSLSGFWGKKQSVLSFQSNALVQDIARDGDLERRNHAFIYGEE